MVALARFFQLSNIVHYCVLFHLSISMEQSTETIDRTEDLHQENIHAALANGLTSFRDAFEVTCRTSDQPHNHCGLCKACLVDAYIHSAKEWWLQTGDLTRRRFLLALIHRLRPDILDHLGFILQPFVNSKGSSIFHTHESNSCCMVFVSTDYTYMRNKFDTSHQSSSSSSSTLKDGADPVKRQEEASRILIWFNREDKHTQGSFILTVLQWCESHLIYTIALTISSLQEIDCKLIE